MSIPATPQIPADIDVRTKAGWHAHVTHLRGGSKCVHHVHDLSSPSTAFQVHCMHIEALTGLRVKITPARGHRVSAPVPECMYQADTPLPRLSPILTGEQAPVCISWDKVGRPWASGWRDITSTRPLQNAGHFRYSFRGKHMFWRGSDHLNTHSFLYRSPNGLSQVVHARQKINAPCSCHQGLEIHAHRKVKSAASS